MTTPRSHLPSFVALCALVAAVPAFARAEGAAAHRPMAVDDISRLREPRDPQLSPDGRWIAYTVRSTDAAKDVRETDIWMSSWDGTQHVRLTSAEGDERAPRFSPDGRFLAFLASRGSEDEKRKGAQVWLLDRRGGEPVKLTDLPGGVADIQWSPDSTRLVLVVADPDPDDTPETKEGWKRATTPPIVITRYWFKDDDVGYRKALYTHLVLFDMTTRKAEPLTSGPYDDTDPSWSPDGRRIAFVSARGPGDPDRGTNTDIFVVDARPGATPQRLTSWPGPDSGQPAWSPDGASIAYLQGDEPRFYAYDLEALAVVSAAGGAARVLTAALDRSVTSPRWTADGAGLVCIVEDDRSRWVGRVAASGGGMVPLTTGRRVVSVISPGGAAGWAVIAGTAKEPDEVHVLAGGSLRRLTHLNDEWVAGLALSPTEDVTFTAADGTVVNALLTKPVAGAGGGHDPAVLYVHGGPDGQDEHAFDVERELLAAGGTVVLQVNYRGSSGRGSAYQKAIYADWGHLEIVDLLAGTDFLVRERLADPERLGIGGWSYGGILTNYVIASDARFRAAVSGAGSSLQTSMYGVDQYIVQYDLEMGRPWLNPERWLKVSYPFFHADRIRTPTLFLGGEKDFNVPLIGSEQMYQALRGVGVESELVIYPDQHHLLSVPSYERDRLARTLAWFERHLRPQAPAPN